MNKLTYVIMAAGIGSRYGGLKQAEPVGPSGELIIHYSVHDALKAGFEKVVFIIRPDIEEIFKERVGRAIEKQVEVVYVNQELSNIPNGFSIPEERVKPWGTGHAVWCARDFVQGNFCVSNADDFYGRETFMNIADFLRNNHDTDSQYSYALVGYTLNKTLSDYGYVSRGICRVDSNNVLTKCVENKHIEKVEGRIVTTMEDGSQLELTGNEPASMNIWGFTLSIFGELEKKFPAFLENDVPLNPLKSEFLLPSIVGCLVDEKKALVKVLPTHEQWYGVTNQEDRPVLIEAISKMIEAGKYPSKLF